MRISYATSLLLVLVLAVGARAQKPRTLDQVEALIKSGQLAQARATLAQWKKEHARTSNSSEEGVRATFLSARLMTNAHDAEDAYLSIVISAPSSSPYIAESLLRVGQAEMAKGAARNAVPYLRRLVDNYPTSEFAITGKMWLARAEGAADRDSLRAVARAAEATKSPSNPPPVNTAPAISAAPPAKGARFAVQVGAFRDKNGARAVARGLSQKGFSDVRLVVVPANALIRVRVGRFANEAAASAALKRVQAAGYKPVIVSDAANETDVRE